MKIDLPTYEQAADEVRDSMKPSALCSFIVEQEPSEVVAGAKFRRELESVLDEAERAAALRQQAYMERKAAKETDERIEELRTQVAFLQSIVDSNVQFQVGFATGIGVGAALVLVITPIILWIRSL